MGQTMKFMTAIINPDRLDDAVETLARLGIRSVTVTETKDYGQRGPTEIYRARQYPPRFLPMLKIETTVPGNRVENVTDAIVRAAKLDRQADDSKTFVFDLEHETHMRIGEVQESVDNLAPRQAA